MENTIDSLIYSSIIYLHYNPYNMAKKELATTAQNEMVPENMISTIKNTVAKEATDDELKMFIMLANKYNLDPFAKEIWFMKIKGKPIIMTSRDGYLKIAQTNADYLGMISFPVHENDEFELDADSYSVKHKLNVKDSGKIIGAWAKAERVGKKPVICYVKFKEYSKPSIDSYGNPTVWGQYPSAMIQKVAEAFALKRLYGISGLVTKEELDDEDSASKTTTVVRTEQGKFVAPILETATEQEPKKKTIEVEVEPDTTLQVGTTATTQEKFFSNVQEAKKALPGVTVVPIDTRPISDAQVAAIEKLWGEIVFLDEKLKDKDSAAMFKQVIGKHTGETNIKILTNPQALTVIHKMTEYLAKLSTTPTPQPQEEQDTSVTPFKE